MTALSLGLAQINPTVGDIEGNVALIAREYEALVKAGARVVICPELALIGYSPEDLLQRQRFRKRAMEAVAELAALTAGKPAGLLLGTLWQEGARIYNAAVYLEKGRVARIFRKTALPNYGVFDEMRHFTPGETPGVLRVDGFRIGILICEDMWRAHAYEKLARQNIDLAVVVNASPYEFQKRRMRTEAAKACVSALQCPLVYVNIAGGQDELVFDGHSFVMDAMGEIVHSLPGFETLSETVTLVKGKACCLVPDPVFRPFTGGAESIYRSMVLGLRDYVEKNRFPGVLIGMSGGVDSALTAAVAVDALGPDRVIGVMMPSRYTSGHSTEDAVKSAEYLNMRLETVAIEPMAEAFYGELAPLFEGRKPDSTEENIQARIRGVILMALSNKFGHMVLTTGNKSEMSVGYATLYGDMCGGYSVLKDVYKTTVYRLAAWRNANLPRDAKGPSGIVIPERVMTKAPSAELRPDQKDQDSLPPYDLLDAILERLVERQLGVETVIAQGYDGALVEKVARMLYAAEYKRRQAPPGVKISGMAFGRDRRYPITNRFNQ